MALPEGYQQAKLQVVGGEEIPCAFNPQDYTITKTNIWTYKPNKSKDMPPPDFGGGMPQRYKISLLLDTSVKRPNASSTKTVTELANSIMKAFHGSGSAPKFMKFSWGAVQLPDAAPVSLSIRYAMFKPNGDPTRAFVDLELAQAKDSTSAFTGQNPTTRAIPGLRVHRVRDGDSLPSIAYQHYGDATRWRAIAEANDVTDPLSLRRGTDLSIPRIVT
jgi:phage tail protein X